MNSLFLTEVTLVNDFQEFTPLVEGVELDSLRNTGRYPLMYSGIPDGTPVYSLNLTSEYDGVFLGPNTFDLGNKVASGFKSGPIVDYKGVTIPNHTLSLFESGFTKQITGLKNNSAHSFIKKNDKVFWIKNQGMYLRGKEKIYVWYMGAPLPDPEFVSLLPLSYPEYATGTPDFEYFVPYLLGTTFKYSIPGRSLGSDLEKSNVLASTFIAYSLTSSTLRQFTHLANGSSISLSGKASIKRGNSGVDVKDFYNPTKEAKIVLPFISGAQVELLLSKAGASVMAIINPHFLSEPEYDKAYNREVASTIVGYLDPQVQVVQNKPGIFTVTINIIGI